MALVMGLVSKIRKGFALIKQLSVLSREQILPSLGLMFIRLNPSKSHAQSGNRRPCHIMQKRDSIE